MKIFDLYGVRGGDIRERLKELSSTLRVEWEQRHSDYIGTYYRASARQYGGSSFEIRPNRLPDDDELQEEAFPDYEFLLYVNKSPRADELKARIGMFPDWEFLRRDVVG